ncbi:hypothetical protein HanXRQr2_Chr16g0753081 [Helianthus annuus]|uniref:Uncharacterized protein n=1 Tax=Helianthus annuus TaxID=4232 RepID=A0A9K3DTI0_HELAN|nr:hypothetical protein HanXRQr2_Chr16g0753071 [Helianthus annuus]KAF5760399.1 hypothetical protein HanXRQr2_Chr16g0753081 [Helianthus annuus]KAJ0932513.1 hypothetical protein HanPSC8_Chr04g0174481 [Helianthus annuus]
MAQQKRIFGGLWWTNKKKHKTLTVDDNWRRQKEGEPHEDRLDVCESTFCKRTRLGNNSIEVEA